MKKIFFAVIVASATTLFFSCSSSTEKSKDELLTEISLLTKNADSLSLLVNSLEIQVSQCRADSATRLLVKNWEAYVEYEKKDLELWEEKEKVEMAAFKKKKASDSESWSKFSKIRSKAFSAFRSDDPIAYAKWVDVKILEFYGDHTYYDEISKVEDGLIKTSKAFSDFKSAEDHARSIMDISDSAANTNYENEKLLAEAKYEQNKSVAWQAFLLKNK